MNKKVQNIALYVDPNFQYYNEHMIVGSSDQNTDEMGKQIEVKQNKNKTTFDNSELFGINSGEVHMYQADIASFNAIDYAFQKNAIFCIKAFVETLLILTGEHQFRNCFDKAILMMISRGMDVKELVNSPLFYAPIWTRYSLFSPNENPVIIGYNNDLEDLEFEDPNLIFCGDANCPRKE